MQLNKEYQRKLQQKQERRHQQHQNYQRRPEFIQAPGDLPPQSVPSIKPPSLVIKETKRQPQQEEGNLVNRSLIQWGYPTSALRLDISNLAVRRSQYHQSQPQTEEQYFYDEVYGASQ
jgi:hypothetical protein